MHSSLQHPLDTRRCPPVCVPLTGYYGWVQASIFVQSHVTAHAELTWLLSCVTPIGWLNRMIQFKEKSLKQVRTGKRALLTSNRDIAYKGCATSIEAATFGG